MYDIIVVGGGHAGCEAAAAAANLGSRVLLLTMNLDNPAKMSCNPAMGGVAKGQILREIDAMGGYSGIVTDYSMIQFRMLNRSKGPAMWSPRAQSDRKRFSKTWWNILQSLPNLEFRQDEVISISIGKEKEHHLHTRSGQNLKCKAVIFTNGTFLNGKIHIGEISYQGGRLGEASSFGLTECLQAYGFVSDRLKTGTPVRIDGRSVDFSKMEEQKGDEIPGKFSYLDSPKLQNQKSCYITYTNLNVHDSLRLGFEKSPMFSGRIQGIGPRYCPSIEDKITRFSDKDRHQLFLEPEGRDTIEYYLNGFSSSLPEEIQVKALHLIPGFKNAKILKPGYAIEYDFFQPTQLKPTLETHLVEHLYFAGQINGTTGYEEAAAQGFMAGINAHLKINEKEAFILSRSQAYIGVLIDDLVNKGVDEPYRMFTSRAEYRILLRQDNADERLSPLSFQIGLASKERMLRLERKQNVKYNLQKKLEETKLIPEQVNDLLQEKGTDKITQKYTIANLLQRPQLCLSDLRMYIPELSEDENAQEILESVEISVKYNAYIQKEKEAAEKLNKLENLALKEDFNYEALKSLSFEAREKLSKIKPCSIGQASRIPGVSPADISVLIIYLSR